MWSFRSLCFLVSLTLTASVAFANAPARKPFDISTPQSFSDQAAQVRDGMQSGGHYAFLSSSDRTRVEQKIAAMDAMFQRFGDVQAMSSAERVDLFNAQETANQILTRGRTGNIRCAWTQPTGSNITRTVCWNTGR